MKDVTFVYFVQESWWKGVCETNCLVHHSKTLNHQPCKEGNKGCISHFNIFLLFKDWYNLDKLEDMSTKARSWSIKMTNILEDYMIEKFNTLEHKFFLMNVNFD
jgi:hypothetical protein